MMTVPEAFAKFKGKISTPTEKETKDASRLDGEADAVEGPDLTEGLGDLLDDEAHRIESLADDRKVSPRRCYTSIPEPPSRESWRFARNRQTHCGEPIP